jgi:hypothetical protein
LELGSSAANDAKSDQADAKKDERYRLRDSSSAEGSRLIVEQQGSNRTIGSGSLGATFRLAEKFDLGRSGEIEKTSLISETLEDRRTRLFC